jgi:hypothetical protein
MSLLRVQRLLARWRSSGVPSTAPSRQFTALTRTLAPCTVWQPDRGRVTHTRYLEVGAGRWRVIHANDASLVVT